MRLQRRIWKIEIKIKKLNLNLKLKLKNRYTALVSESLSSVRHCRFVTDDAHLFIVFFEFGPAQWTRFHITLH